MEVLLGSIPGCVRINCSAFPPSKLSQPGSGSTPATHSPWNQSCGQTPSLPLPKLMISSCHAGGERNPSSPPETTELTSSQLRSSPLSPVPALPRKADKEPLCRELSRAGSSHRRIRSLPGEGSSCKARCYPDTRQNKSVLTPPGPARLSMENIKGLANQKKNPAGKQEMPSVPRWSG